MVKLKKVLCFLLHHRVQSSDFRVLFTNKYKMEIQYPYSPRKAPWLGIKGGYKKPQYTEQPKKEQ
jgi:hypothetical protein